MRMFSGRLASTARIPRQRAEIAEFFFPPDCLRDRPELIEIFAATAVTTARRRGVAASWRRPVAADLSGFDRPTLCSPAASRLIPNAKTFAIARDLKRAKTRVIEQVGHVSSIQAPERVAEADDCISEFGKRRVDNTGRRPMADQTSVVPFDEAPVTTRYWLSIILFAVTGVVDFFDFFVSVSGVGAGAEMAPDLRADLDHADEPPDRRHAWRAGVGLLADRFGRKPLAVAVSSAASVPGDCADTGGGWIFFCDTALFVGFGLARGAAAAVPAIVEFAPTRTGRWLPASCSSVAFGVLSASTRRLSVPLVGLARARRGRLPADHPRDPEPLLSCRSRPRWLISKGLVREAQTSIRKLYQVGDQPFCPGRASGLPARARGERAVAICRLKRVAADYKDDIRDRLPKAGRRQNRQAHCAGGRRPSLAPVARDLAPLGYRCVVLDQDQGRRHDPHTDPTFPVARIDHRRESITSSISASSRRRQAASTASRHASPRAGMRFFVGSGAAARRNPKFRPRGGQRPTSTSVSTGCPRSPSPHSARSQTRDRARRRQHRHGLLRSSRRLGGEDVKVVVRSGFEEMKASPWEKEDAMHEDIPILNFLCRKSSPTRTAA